jgi:putative ABC transport system permease protein
VLIQFLLEAVVLALLGGVLRMLPGMAGALELARLAHWPLVISPGIVILAFVVSAGVDIFFGYYPALRASRLDPIQALRYE